MPTIKLLPETLINQIAAGEVVERPASVVKELVENSLDAGAKRVTVEVHGGGDEFIRITDDGTGMDREDAVLAFERHATSKIVSAEDLFNIRFLGFRGEAIASIASVSYLTLQTKKRGEKEGTIVVCEGGKIKKTKAAGAPEGTQIELKQLFYNTPARRKYLKSPGTEYGRIVDTVTGLALAHPETAFRLVHDDKAVFDLPPADNHLTRIRSLLGKEMAEELIPVFNGHTLINLQGYVGKPGIARANRNGQYLFVNNREVKSHVLSYAVKQSFHSLLPKERYPVFLLFFKIDPALVDVNVHPRKEEVRFADEKQIFRIVMQSCEKALENFVLAPKISDAGPVNYYQLRPAQSPFTFEDAADGDSGFNKTSNRVPNSADNDANPSRRGNPMPVSAAAGATVDDALNFTKEISYSLPQFDGGQLSGVRQSGSANLEREEPNGAILRSEGDEIIPLAQIGNSYILCEQGKKLVLVDQHAAHERIRYTEIVAQFESRDKAVQPLLLPVQFELNHREVPVLEENMEILAGMGFEIEPFGGNTFSIQAVPTFIVKQDLGKTIRGLIDDFENNSVKGDFQQRKERALTYMACRSAVKFGDKLSPEEQKSLLKKLQAEALPYTCPHGRPTMVTMTFDELEKRFGRRYV